MREVVGSGSNKLFQSGGVYSSCWFMTLTLSNQRVNVTERGRKINIDVFTNVCSSFNQPTHTLQCNDRTGCKLHATLSVQMAERRQINHSQGATQGLLVRSGIHNSSILQATKWRVVKKEISEGRKVWKWNEWKALTDERNGRSLKKGLETQWNSLKRRQVYSITSFLHSHLATQALMHPRSRIVPLQYQQTTIWDEEDLFFTPYPCDDSSQRTGSGRSSHIQS